jgi:hypothetical protein
MVQAKLSEGKFEESKCLSEAGLYSSRQVYSTEYEIKFYGYLLISLSMLRATDNKPQDDWQTNIDNYQNMLSEKAVQNNLILSIAWEILGDVFELVHPEKLEAIEHSFAQAREYLIKFLLPKNNRSIPVSPTSPFLVQQTRILYKQAVRRKLILNFADSHQLVSEAFKIGKYVRHVLPRDLIVQLSLLQAENLYQTRFLQRPGSSTQEKLETTSMKTFSDIAKVMVDDGGDNYRVLRASFDGLLAIAIDNGIPSKDLTASLAEIGRIQAIVNKMDYSSIKKELLDEIVLFDQNDDVLRFIWNNLNRQKSDSDLKMSVLVLLEAKSLLTSKLAPLDRFPFNPFHQSLGIRIRRLQATLINKISNKDVMEKISFSKNELPPFLSKDRDSLISTKKTEQAYVQWVELPIMNVDAALEDHYSGSNLFWTMVIHFAESASIVKSNRKKKMDLKAKSLAQDADSQQEEKKITIHAAKISLSLIVISILSIKTYV